MIDEKAIVHPDAKIADGVHIGAGSIIGPNVCIEEGTWIGPYVVISGHTHIGRNNKIFQFASLGDEPQDITYKGEDTRLEIGDDNVIREYCMLSRGTIKGGGVTRVGNNNFLMAHTHVGHDCQLGNQIIMVNYSALSGHVLINDYAIIGAYAAVHQFCQVGAYAFIARATYVNKDVLPYVMIAGHETSACGINTVGLRRRGFSAEAIQGLRKAYKIIFRQGLTVQQALEQLELMQQELPEVILMIDSLNNATRGIVR